MLSKTGKRNNIVIGKQKQHAVIGTDPCPGKGLAAILPPVRLPVTHTDVKVSPTDPDIVAALFEHMLPDAPHFRKGNPAVRAKLIDLYPVTASPIQAHLFGCLDRKQHRVLLPVSRNRNDLQITDRSGHDRQIIRQKRRRKDCRQFNSLCTESISAGERFHRKPGLLHCGDGRIRPQKTILYTVNFGITVQYLRSAGPVYGIGIGQSVGGRPDRKIRIHCNQRYRRNTHLHMDKPPYSRMLCTAQGLSSSAPSGRV